MAWSRAVFEKRAFDAILSGASRLARARAWSWSVPPLMRGLAAMTRVMRGARSSETHDPAALGRAWQASFPSAKMVPITRVDRDTAYGEIRIRCPLRGTGDVAACHRLMAYDRALMAPHHARFVVLRSQAAPGVEVCEIAIRTSDLAHDDLVPAHRLRRAR